MEINRLSSMKTLQRIGEAMLRRTGKRESVRDGVQIKED
jgi:hypothetical protein